MQSIKRQIWFFTLVAFMFTTTGCARTYLRPVDEEIARGGTGIEKDRGQNVRGYLLADSTMVDYKGFVRLTGQDSLIFWSKGYSEEVRHRGQKEEIMIPGPVYPFSAVEALDVYDARSGRSALLFITGTLVLSSLIWAATGGGFYE